MPHASAMGARGRAWAGPAALALVLFLLYLAMVPGNHSDTEDAYLYAQRVEQGTPAELLHPHHMLYLPLMRLLWRGACALGYDGRPFALLLVVSALAGACAAALFARLLQRRREAADHGEARPCVGVPWALALAFSYGFWRYALAVEIVTLSLLGALGVLSAVLFRKPGPRRAVIVAALSALSILVHGFNLFPAGAGVTLYYLQRRCRRLALLHAVLTLLLTAVGYGLLMRWAGSTVSLFGAVHRDHAFGAGSFFRAAVALAQSLLSGNFLFGYTWFAEWLTSRLPERMLLEQVFMGRHAPRATLWAPWVTLALCAVAGVGMLVHAWDRKGARAAGARRCTGNAADVFAGDTLFLVWGGLHAAAILLVHPGNPEMWVPLAVPLWYGASVLLQPASKRGQRFPWILGLAIFCHNSVGGMWPLASPQGDYLAAKAAPVLALERPGDVIVTGDTEVFIRYLAYHARAKTRPAATLDPQQAAALLADKPGRVFVLGDVFEPPPSLRHRFPERYARTLRVAQALRDALLKVDDDDFGGLYIWLGPDHKPPVKDTL